MLRRFDFIIFLFLIAVNSYALGPMYSFCDLVAGEGTPGLENGTFYSALFNHPTGLAADPTENKLYVADSENHCIRSIDLSDENRVDTLVGQDKPGFMDGLFTQAQFNGPSLVVCLPQHQLAVVDQGNYRIRLVDMEKKTVTTLAGNGEAESKDGVGTGAQIGKLWSLAYLELTNELYFSEPESGALRSMNLKTGEVRTLLKNDGRILKPGALCVNQGKLFVADREAPILYELTPKKGKDGFDFRSIACHPKTSCLAWTDGALYSAQEDVKNTITRLLPSPRNIGPYNSWGESLPNFSESMLLSEAVNGLSLGLVCDPNSPRRFFLVHPSYNIVSSIRDLDQADLMGNEDERNSLLDFDYPTVKPPRVYRILLVGDSHSFYNYNTDGSRVSNRMSLFPKRLELDLNTIAALNDAPIRFEVLTLAKVSNFLMNLWPYYDVPPMVRKYDVDMVFMLLGARDEFFNIYLDRPIKADGIPAKEMDTEFMLKPFKDKTLDPSAKRIVEICLEKKWASLDKNGKLQLSDFNLMRSDPEIREKMVELDARPIKALRKRLLSYKTQNGSPVQMVTCLQPYFHFLPLKVERSFWQGLVDEIGGPVVNVLDLATAFRLGYYPLSEDKDFDHFNGHGHEFVAFLVANELAKQKLIPMERESEPKESNKSGKSD